MADENKTINNPELIDPTTPTEVASPKKRGPRQKKITSEATAEIPETNTGRKVVRGRKRKEKTVEMKPAAQPRTTSRALASRTPAEAQTSVLDEIADLVQLEEENARLRRALADKLRSENADLRKRLGLA